MSLIKGHLQALRNKYNEDGIEGIITDTKKYVEFRWNRLFLHPSVNHIRRYYLNIIRYFFSDHISDADPFKIIYVDPSEIEYRVTNVGQSSSLITGNVGADWGRVYGGKWDLQPIEKMSRYQLFESRYVDGKDWSELPYENTSGRRRDKLHQAIKNEGYKSQWELQKSKKKMITP